MTTYDLLHPSETSCELPERGYIVTLCGYQKLSEAFQDVPEHVRDLPHDFIRIQTSCRFFPNIGLYGLRVSLTFFHALNICVKPLQVSLYLISYITFFEEDVDIKYMSIYKEENNKKDCFEHLISLQGCGITAQETFLPSVSKMAI